MMRIVYLFNEATYSNAAGGAIIVYENIINKCIVLLIAPPVSVFPLCSFSSIKLKM